MDEKLYEYTALCLEDEYYSIKEEILVFEQLLHVKVLRAKNYSQALQVLSEHRFQLFILDIELKGERSTGIQFAEVIRTHPNYVCTPILFVSVHNHFSYMLLSRFQNSAFLRKPFSSEALIEQCGTLLNIPKYVQRHYQAPIFTIYVSKETQLELSPKTISYIEANNKILDIQYIDGRLEHFRCYSGAFKKLIQQIENSSACRLRQIHRSIIVNIDQIRYVEIQRNTGDVWLFNDDTPKPLGISYRHNISELFEDMKGDSNGAF